MKFLQGIHLGSIMAYYTQRRAHTLLVQPCCATSPRCCGTINTFNGAVFQRAHLLNGASRVTLGEGVNCRQKPQTETLKKKKKRAYSAVKSDGVALTRLSKIKLQDWRAGCCGRRLRWQPTWTVCLRVSPVRTVKGGKAETYGVESKLMLLACVDDADLWLDEKTGRLGEAWITWSTRWPTDDGRSRVPSCTNSELLTHKNKNSQSCWEFNKIDKSLKCKSFWWL